MSQQVPTKDEQLTIVLEQNELFRKRAVEGSNSLLHAISNALYFTGIYASDLQGILFKHLADLISEKKLSKGLGKFEGNKALLEAYIESSNLSKFDKINLELTASLFKVKIVVYNLDEDENLNSVIFNSVSKEKIELVKTGNYSYESLHSKDFMFMAATAQNVILNMIELVINNQTVLPFRNINNDTFINYQYLNSPKRVEDKKTSTSKNKKVTRKRSSSQPALQKVQIATDDSLEKYNIFKNIIPAENLVSYIKNHQKLKTTSSNTNDTKIIKKPKLHIPIRNDSPEKNTPTATSIQQHFSYTYSEAEPSPFYQGARKKEAMSTHGNPYRRINMIEEQHRYSSSNTVSPVHFMNMPPPGITPSRYAQKIFTYSEPTSVGQFGPDIATSPGFQRSEHAGTPSGMYNLSTPTRKGFGPASNSNYLASPNSNIINPDTLYAKRTGNSDVLMLSVQSTAGNVSQDSAQADSTAKKKPIILDESKKRYTGRLKFFDEAKNYGFIIMDEDSSDIFVHMDDLMKANISKDTLRQTKNGNMLRLTFNCMTYIGKHQKSRKAIDIEFLEQQS